MRFSSIRSCRRCRIISRLTSTGMSINIVCRRQSFTNASHACISVLVMDISSEHTVQYSRFSYVARRFNHIPNTKGLGFPVRFSSPLVCLFVFVCPPTLCSGSFFALCFATNLSTTNHPSSTATSSDCLRYSIFDIDNGFPKRPRPFWSCHWRRPPYFVGACAG